MNKFYLIVLLNACIFLNAAAQDEALPQFTHSYFRSDPFLGQFSAFLAHLTKDPAISAKQMRLRTDTSLFEFAGVYQKYNPFFFKPVKIEISLRETPVQYADSASVTDTLLIYQLTAFPENSEAGRKEVKKEFEKIHRQYARRFFDTNYNEFTENGAVVGEYHNYFVPMHGIAPLTVAWGLLQGNNQPVLNITLRMKTSDNIAVLPVPLYHP